MHRLPFGGGARRHRGPERSTSFKRFSSPLYVAAAMWNHGPQMADAMKAQGIERPTLSGSELGT